MRRSPGRRELAVFALGYLTYFGVRAVTEGRVDRALANAASIVHLERYLGIAWEGAVQGMVAGSEALQDIVNAIYVYGHWPVVFGAGALLYRFRRDQYYSLRNVCLLTGALGLFIFACFPVAPPRLTGLPLLDTVTRGTPGYRQLFPPALVNQYAAMPSFHAGWNLAVGIAVFRATHHWAVRALAVAMPFAMAFAVIATANHFVIDVLAGVGLVLIAFRLQRASLVPRRRQIRFARDGQRAHTGRPARAARPGLARPVSGRILSRQGGAYGQSRATGAGACGHADHFALSAHRHPAAPARTAPTADRGFAVAALRRDPDARRAARREGASHGDLSANRRGDRRAEDL